MPAKKTVSVSESSLDDFRLACLNLFWASTNFMLWVAPRYAEIKTNPAGFIRSVDQKLAEIRKLLDVAKSLQSSQMWKLIELAVADEPSVGLGSTSHQAAMDHAATLLRIREMHDEFDPIEIPKWAEQLSAESQAAAVLQKQFMEFTGDATGFMKINKEHDRAVLRLEQNISLPRSAAAKRAGISDGQLSRVIKSGHITANADGTIPIQECDRYRQQHARPGRARNQIVDPTKDQIEAAKQKINRSR